MTADEFQAQYGRPTAKQLAKKNRTLPDEMSAETFRKNHVDQIEHDIQATILDWFYKNPRHRDLLLYAVPNGGPRSKYEAYAKAREGLTRGIPDLMLAVANDTYHGLYLETKTQRGVLSDDQKLIHAKLTKAGYLVVIPRSIEDAQGFITDYLKTASI